MVSNKLTVTINLLAEHEDEQYYCAAMLRRIADKIEDYDYNVGSTSSILDINGNRVGSWKFHLEGVE